MENDATSSRRRVDGFDNRRARVTARTILERIVAVDRVGTDSCGENWGAWSMSRPQRKESQRARELHSKCRYLHVWNSVSYGIF